METYLERVVGEDVYNHFGRQFPLLIKFLDINEKLSVQVHPDDQIAAERYDSLGKAEIWYIMDAKPGAKMYCGFNRDTTAQEFYDRCLSGTVEEILNVIYPKKGDVIFITPGTVHAADGGILIAEIQESSDMTFRLYDWGREFNPATARKMHLEEAIDLIDYKAFDPSIYRKGPLWDKDDCTCHDCGHDHHHEDEVVETLVESPQFNVAKLNLKDPLHIYTEKFDSFIIYICIEGAASIQVPSTKEGGEAFMDNYEFKKGETILVPADMPDFFLVPRDRETLLLEAVTRPEEEIDQYIDPDTEAFLEGEDYEGIEDETDEPSAPAGASPLNFFN
jgi:mannose-6-phosphate isomerase